MIHGGVERREDLVGELVDQWYIYYKPHFYGKSYFMIFFMLGRLDSKIVGMVGCAGGVMS